MSRTSIADFRSPGNATHGGYRRVTFANNSTHNARRRSLSTVHVRSHARDSRAISLVTYTRVCNGFARFTMFHRPSPGVFVFRRPSVRRALFIIYCSLFTLAVPSPPPPLHTNTVANVGRMPSDRAITPRVFRRIIGLGRGTKTEIYTRLPSRITISGQWSLSCFVRVSGRVTHNPFLDARVVANGREPVNENGKPTAIVHFLGLFDGLGKSFPRACLFVRNHRPTEPTFLAIVTVVPNESDVRIYCLKMGGPLTNYKI